MSSENPIHPGPPPSINPSPEPAPAPPPPPPVPAPVYVTVVERKSPVLAGFLSVFPGLGHLYLGLYQRAFAFAFSFITSIVLVSHGRGPVFFGLLIWFILIFAIIDAVRQAHAINRGQVTEGGFAPSPQIAKAREGTAALTWGVILVGLGSLWLLNEYANFDWFWEVIGSWGGPAAFILLGLILIITHVKR